MKVGRKIYWDAKGEVITAADGRPDAGQRARRAGQPVRRRALHEQQRFANLEAEVLVEGDRCLDVDDPDERDQLAHTMLGLLHRPWRLALGLPALARR